VKPFDVRDCHRFSVYTRGGYRNPAVRHRVPPGILNTVGTDTSGVVHGYAIDKAAYLKRLKRIEGQVRGLQRMIDDDTYCIDILTQVSAVTKALQSVAVGLLDQHVRHCVANAVTDDQHGRAMIDEATRAIERLIKS
jgi:DNA-binding FrmR family transcriptional regulator